MSLLKIIFSLTLILSNIYAKEKQTNILVNYKYDNLEYVKTLDNNILEGDYNASILISPKMVKRNIKYKNILLEKEKLILQPNETKYFKIELDELLDIKNYPNFKVLYKSLNPFLKSQKFAEYQITLQKDEDISIIQFGHPNLNENLKLDIDLDLLEASYKPKDKTYLIKRMLGIDLDNIWRTTSITHFDLIQRRFNKKLTANDVLQIWTKKDVEIHNVIFMGKNKINLPISFLDKKSDDKFDIYSLDINKLLKQYLPKENEIVLKELQLFLDVGFKIGDVQKLKFLHSMIDKKKVLNDYKVNVIKDNMYSHSLDLKMFQKYKIKTIEIKIKNTQNNILVLKDIKASLFSKKNFDIPLIFDKYFTKKIYEKKYDELKKISLDTLIKDNNITKIVNLKNINLHSNTYFVKSKNNVALINLNNMKNEEIFLDIPIQVKESASLNISCIVNSNYKVVVNKKNIKIVLPENTFEKKDSIVISDLTLNYIDKNLSIRKLLKEDTLLELNNQSIFINDINDIFAKNQQDIQFHLKDKQQIFNTNISKYYEIDNITLTSNISKEDFFKLDKKKQTNDIVVKSESRIIKILKLLFYLLIIFLLFKIRRTIWTIMMTLLLKIKLFTEFILYFSFQWTKLEKLLIYSLFYIIISCFLYYFFIYSGRINLNNTYLNLGNIFLVISISYFSFYLKPFILAKFNKLGRKIYRGYGSIYFAWALLFLIFTVIFVGMNLEVIAEQFAIVVYYLLVWGIIKELMSLKKSLNGL
jgi:hypothetical protein